MAAVAVASLLDDAHAGSAYEVTGLEALDLHEIATLVGRVTGQEVRYVEETLDEARASRAEIGAPD